MKILFPQTQASIFKSAADAALDAAKKAASDAKDAALAAAQESIDALEEMVNEKVRELEVQVVESIMKPVEKVTDVLNTINEIKLGFPNCVNKVQKHIDGTVATMDDDLKKCKDTAFKEIEELFRDCFTAIYNFPDHTTHFVKKFEHCLDIKNKIFMTACVTHDLDDYQNLIREDITIATQILKDAPGRAPPIIERTTVCSTRAVNKAYDSLTKTLEVIKKCAGI